MPRRDASRMKPGFASWISKITGQKASLTILSISLSACWELSPSPTSATSGRSRAVTGPTSSTSISRAITSCPRAATIRATRASRSRLSLAMSTRRCCVSRELMISKGVLRFSQIRWYERTALRPTPPVSACRSALLVHRVDSPLARFADAKSRARFTRRSRPRENSGNGRTVPIHAREHAGLELRFARVSALFPRAQRAAVPPGGGDAGRRACRARPHDRESRLGRGGAPHPGRGPRSGRGRLAPAQPPRSRAGSRHHETGDGQDPERDAALVVVVAAGVGVRDLHDLRLERLSASAGRNVGLDPRPAGALPVGSAAEREGDVVERPLTRSHGHRGEPEVALAVDEREPPAAVAREHHSHPVARGDAVAPHELAARGDEPVLAASQQRGPAARLRLHHLDGHVPGLPRRDGGGVGRQDCMRPLGARVGREGEAGEEEHHEYALHALATPAAATRFPELAALARRTASRCAY